MKQRVDAGLIDILIGRVRYAEALHLLEQGSDPQRAVGDARLAFQRVAGAVPWVLDYSVWCARVEILGIRWAVKQNNVQPAMFEAGLAPIRPFESEMRFYPDLYQTRAEIHALRAAWLVGTGRSAAGDITQGLAMVDKALAINPHMAKAFAAKAHIHLVEARAARDGSVRREAAARAEEAFRAAFHHHPLLKREHGAALREAERLR